MPYEDIGLVIAKNMNNIQKAITDTVTKLGEAARLTKDEFILIPNGVKYNDQSCPICSKGAQCGITDHSRWTCTREAGHIGKHVACGFDDVHRVHVWKTKADEFQVGDSVQVIKGSIRHFIEDIDADGYKPGVVRMKCRRVVRIERLTHASQGMRLCMSCQRQYKKETFHA